MSNIWWAAQSAYSTANGYFDGFLGQAFGPVGLGGLMLLFLIVISCRQERNPTIDVLFGLLIACGVLTVNLYLTGRFP